MTANGVIRVPQVDYLNPARHLRSRRSVTTAASVDFVTSERNERPSVAFGHLTAAQIRAAVLARGAFLPEFEPHNPGEEILFVRRGVGQAPE
jgi:hypothetical protein